MYLAVISLRRKRETEEWNVTNRKIYWNCQDNLEKEDMAKMYTHKTPQWSIAFFPPLEYVIIIIQRNFGTSYIKGNNDHE